MITIKYLVVEVENDRGQTRFLQADEDFDVEFYSEEDAHIWIKNRNSEGFVRWYAIIKLYK